MNFQQLRSVREAVRQGFNLTAVAASLHTSQPGVSRQIRELEDELGIELFVRKGKRLTGLTEPGKELVGIVERMLMVAPGVAALWRESGLIQSRLGNLLAAKLALSRFLELADNDSQRHQVARLLQDINQRLQ